MSESILDTTKKVLGVPPDYTAFDTDIVMHINTVFTTLVQLGVGPPTGFMIESKEETWDAFLGEDLQLNSVKSFMYLKVRMLFDPPATGPATQAMKAQADELEWRIQAHRESTQWVNPMPLKEIEEDPIDGAVLDSGTI